MLYFTKFINKIDPAKFDKYFLFRIVLLGLYFKFVLSTSYTLADLMLAELLPLEDNFFPAFLRNSYLSFFCHFAPLSAGLVLFFTKKSNIFLLFSLFYLICSFVLLAHQNSYSNAEHVIDFWLSIWMLWFSININEDISVTTEKSVLLCLSIISMIFLCAGLGKVCEAYTNGIFINDMLNEKSGMPVNVNFVKYFSYLALYVNMQKFSVIISYFIIMSELITATVVFWRSKKTALLWIMLISLLMPITCQIVLFTLTAKMFFLSLSNLLMLCYLKEA